MKTILLRVRRLTFAAIFGGGVCTFFFFALPDTLSVHLTAFVLLVAETIVLAVLALRARYTLNSARLIVENELLHICPAVNAAGDGMQSGNAAMDIFISCFGILLDSRVIRFNRKANRLRRVEIGREVITLTYGPDARVSQMAVLHQAIDDETARNIARRFRFETGAETVLDTGFIK